jgi:glycosyltransferase involved in cell wall biosynthesis
VGHAYLSLINREKWAAYKKQFPHDEVTVVTPCEWNDALFSLKNELDSDGYIHLPIAHSGNEVLHRYAWTDVWRVMRSVSPDVLLVEQGDNAFSYFQWIVVSLLQFRNIPRIFFTWVNWKHPWGWRYRFFWWPIEIFNRFFSRAAIVGNPEAQELLREKNFTGPVLVSPQLGVSLEHLAEHAKLTDVARPKVIGFVGRLAQEKGVSLLLEAFAQIADRFPEWSLCVVGSGRERDALVALTHALHIHEKVVFTGSVDHYRAVQLIQSFDVFVLPSLDTPTWKEQFGHVIIEAMMAGVPVVGSDAGAIAWVIGDAGLVFPQKSVTALRDALCNYMSHEEVRVLYGARGLTRVKELYSHDVIARNIGNFLHSLV